MTIDTKRLREQCDLAYQEALTAAHQQLAAMTAARDELQNIACDVLGSLPELSNVNYARLRRIKELGKVGQP